ncbi:polyprenyl synthetase family protein [Demequina sp. NBRC 110053]|uniref:polyprenyl synthetase family protein n=1 Tax=Demequina sp. NBRC 110053 TaxID=1570342 RepID=UPI0013564EBF|nr:polyprenyl synthetase family protein [Demequina sp. NBRC 110053]
MTPLMTSQDLQASVDARLPLVEAALREHVTGTPHELPNAGSEYRRMWQRIGEQFVGGKNLRPALTLAAYFGLSGEDTEAVVPVAAAMEMMHTAMLVHDDILDHDEVRRGRPNIAGARRAELAQERLPRDRTDDHVLTAALLSGDLALSSAYDLIARSALPAHHRLACLNLLTRGIRATIAGELLDMSGDLTPIGEADALNVAELKTATYSCVVPLLAGATIAGADPTMIGHLERIGTSLGLSFQLVDDDLGVFGDPDVTGKSNLSDLRAGKRTELMRQAYAAATPAQLGVLDRHVGDADLDDDGAAAVREILEESGARGRTLAIARRHARQASRIARERVPAPLSGYLLDLVDWLDGRAS